MKTIVFLILVLATSLSHAVTISFDCIEGTVTNCAFGETNLSATVTDSDPMITVNANQVLFTFFNDTFTMGDDAVVTQIYFDDGSTSVLDDFANTGMMVAGKNGLFETGTDFLTTNPPPGPGDLPGGNDPGVLFSSDFSVGAQASVANNGLTSNDSLAILFDLVMGVSFQDVIDQLASGDLRIGLHVQSFPSDGESGSFVNTPVPLPAAFWLFGSALVFFGSRLKRRGE